MAEKKFDKFKYSKKSEKQMIDLSKSFYENIKHRRTVRDFKEIPVPEELIHNAILSAGTAPNGANMQPWHFVVVTDPKIKHKIRLAAEKEEQAFYNGRASEEWLHALEKFDVNANKPFLDEAPCLIVVFIKSARVDNEGKTHKTYYPIESVGIATGMLLTALHFSGLATLTHTPSPMKFLNKILDRPSYERPFVVVVTGFPKDDAMVPSINKLPLNEITSFFNEMIKNGD